MSVDFYVSGGVVPWSKKGGKVTINNCPGLNDLKSVFVFLKWTNIADKKKVYYQGIYFGKPHLVDQNSEQGIGVMKVETEKQSLQFKGSFANLLTLRTVCVRMQEVGKNSCVYCKAPKRCPVNGLLKKLNG